MSWSRLQQFGVLNDGHEGLSCLLAVANKSGMGPTLNAGNKGLRHIPRTYTGTFRNRKHLDTDRPKWSYPKTYDELSTEQLIKVRKVQDLLIELGPTMVKEGMLAP